MPHCGDVPQWFYKGSVFFCNLEIMQLAMYSWIKTVTTKKNLQECSGCYEKDKI